MTSAPNTAFFTPSLVSGDTRQVMLQLAKQFDPRGRDRYVIVVFVQGPVDNNAAAVQ